MAPSPPPDPLLAINMLCLTEVTPHTCRFQCISKIYNLLICCVFYDNALLSKTFVLLQGAMVEDRRLKKRHDMTGSQECRLWDHQGCHQLLRVTLSGRSWVSDFLCHRSLCGGINILFLHLTFFQKSFHAEKFTNLSHTCLCNTIQKD